MARRRRRSLGWLFLGLVLGMLVGAGYWLQRELRPMPSAPAQYLRVPANQAREVVYKELARKRVVRNLVALELLARLRQQPPTVREGTYRLRAGMTADQILRALQTPVKQNVRIPEGWWIRRVAQRLQAREVCSAEEYIRLANDASHFARWTKAPIPRKGSLEGFLFPDTYELPPQLGAEAVIRRQLRAFEQKVVPIMPPDANVKDILTIASMVELEAALDEERPRVAGVITNRIDRRMTLDIDATVLYALQEWKVLGPGVVRTVESPYNTYLNRGLPPGPIGSPGLASIRAALRPEAHNYLFYVARPDRSHIFTPNYDQHRAAIRRARAEFRAARAQAAERELKSGAGAR